MAKLPAQPNQSLMNGLACLQAVAVSTEPVGTRQLARELGLDHTRVSRLLGTLLHLGLVAQTPERKYIAGSGIHVLSAQSLYGSGLLKRALPYLRPLVKERLTLALGVLWRWHVCYLVHAKPGQQPEDAIGAHTPYPAHKSIGGLALLSACSDAELNDMKRLADPPLSNDEFSLLLTEVRRTREEGLARRGTDDGWSSLAVCIGSPPVAALSLTGEIKASRLPELERKLRDAAARIETG